MVSRREGPKTSTCSLHFVRYPMSSAERVWIRPTGGGIADRNLICPMFRPKEGSANPIWGAPRMHVQGHLQPWGPLAALPLYTQDRPSQARSGNGDAIALIPSVMPRRSEPSRWANKGHSGIDRYLELERILDKRVRDENLCMFWRRQSRYGLGSANCCLHSANLHAGGSYDTITRSRRTDSLGLSGSSHPSWTGLCRGAG